MTTQTMTTAKKPSGCGCGSSGGKTVTAPCSCGGCGCNLCAAPTSGYVRPQFFSGQLLTEDDLRSLVDYVTGKNRLHNRMLFGDGVVCGLKVTIDPCPPVQPCVHQLITVSAGYALDCCGNDIFVPCDVELDFPQLLRDLKLRLLGKDCGDPCKNQDNGNAAGAANPPKPNVAGIPQNPAFPPSQGAATTDDKTKTYCLYVRYCEQSSDPVVPYDSDAPCGITDCQDTRIREGFRFELRCPPQEPAQTSKALANGTLRLYRAQYLQKPVAELQKAYASRDPQDLLTAIGHVEEVLSLAPIGNDTEIVAQLASARYDIRNRAGTEQVVLRVASALTRYWAEGSCDVLLPDCAPCEDDAVLIACLEVNGCDVLTACNVRRRTILSPAYFEFLGLPDLITRVLVAECCGPRKKFVSGAGNLRQDENLKAWLASLRAADPIPDNAAHPTHVDRALDLLAATAAQRDPGIAAPPTIEDPFSFARYMARTAGLATLLDTKAEDHRVDELSTTISMQKDLLRKQETELNRQADKLATQEQELKSHGDRLEELREELNKLAGAGPAAPRGKKQPPNS
jgi:hypothetical protein